MRANLCGNPFSLEISLAHILVCALPNPGHVSPMFAVAQHLKGMGHDVTLHTAELFRNKVESGGIRFVPLAGKANYDYRRPAGIEGAKNFTGDEHTAYVLKILFADTIPDLHQSVQGILRATPVDLILVDTAFFGVFPLLLGPREGRPPVIGCGVNPMVLSSRDCGQTQVSDNTPEGRRRVQEENEKMRATFQSVHDAINAKLQVCGAPQMPHFFFDCMYWLPDLFLQFTSEDFEFPRSDMPDSISFAGPLLPAPSAGFEEPEWWSDLDDWRPVVLVTQGTLANQDFNELIQPALNGLAGEEVLVVVAAGRKDTETIVVPANARVAAFVPFDRLLPKVDVMVTNGGYGAVNHALSLGVPIVSAGETEDKIWVNARVGWTGAGINLKTRFANSEQIRDAVRAILTNEQYREEAQRLRANFARYNALEKVTEMVDKALAREGKLATLTAS